MGGMSQIYPDFVVNLTRHPTFFETTRWEPNFFGVGP